MATINKITEILAAIKAIYPYYAKESDVTVLARTWNMLLQPYEDKMVDAAMTKCLQICKMPPTPADVIEQIQNMCKAFEETDEELWAIYLKALRDTSDQLGMFTYTYVDHTGISQGQQARNKVEQIWQGLPDKIKRYLASKGELMRNAREYNESADFASYEKSRFIKSMPVMAKRQEYDGLMLEGRTQHMLLD